MGVLVSEGHLPFSVELGTRLLTIEDKGVELPLSKELSKCNNAKYHTFRCVFHIGQNPNCGDNAGCFIYEGRYDGKRCQERVRHWNCWQVNHGV